MEKVSWKLNYFKADAEKCFAEMQELDEITPENVLLAAEDEESELHKCFEWDDSVAAEKYRLSQARQIIQFLVVKTETVSEPVRVYQITSERNVYQPTKLFLQQPDEYAILLNRAKDELKAIRKRYKQISELESVFEAIDEL